MGEEIMKKSAATSALGAIVIAVTIVVGGATPASAATVNVGPESCSGQTVFINSRTTFGTSHNVWVSSTNNEGTSWTGNAVYRWRAFTSTKTLANATYVTATNINFAQNGCAG
jgi:hypothetical protein